jgi:CheY-like chemotaxis protein
MKCFLIDDDIDDQELFLMALEKVGRNIECTIANDGIHALEILRRNEEYVPDYIFLDVNMPRMNGLQTLAEIKKISALRSTDVIMFSTSSERAIIESSKQLGASKFEVKPTGLTALVNTLSSILQAF